MSSTRAVGMGNGRENDGEQQEEGDATSSGNELHTKADAAHRAEVTFGRKICMMACNLAGLATSEVGSMPMNPFRVAFIAPAIFLLQTAFAWLLALDQPSAALTDRQEIIHVLNRITFGPRPGDVEAVQKVGLDAYLDQQLHPETIDDSATDAELRKLDLLQATAPELANLFYDDIKRFLKKQKKLTENSAAVSTTDTPRSAAFMPASVRGDVMDLLSGWRSVAAVQQLEQGKLIRAIESKRQLQEVLVDFWTNHFNIDVKKGPCRVLKIVDDRDVIRPHVFSHFRDLLEASAKSPAMLFYLDNAENSVARQVSPLEQQMQAAFLKKTGGELDVDLPAPKKKQGGINENYAREIMELHTLGVNGGYTQKDVQEVARCFTGWTLNRRTGEFLFTPRRHDTGQKLVLGQVIPAGGGMEDGERVLDILASAPATATFISRELCQRFVSDSPSDALVDRIAQVFSSTSGDLRQVVVAILKSPEFLSPAAYQSKIKSPLEFAVSAVRATKSDLQTADSGAGNKIRAAVEGAAILGRAKAGDRLSNSSRQSLNWHIYELGEPLFACTPPTGYKEVSKIWVSPGALIERLNFALSLTEQRIADVQFDPKKILTQADLDKPEAVLNQSVSDLLEGNISPATRKVLEQAALPPAGSVAQTVNPSKIIALILGSPEFQRK